MCHEVVCRCGSAAILARQCRRVVVPWANERKRLGELQAKLDGIKIKDVALKANKSSKHGSTSKSKINKKASTSKPKASKQV